MKKLQKWEGDENEEETENGRGVDFATYFRNLTNEPT